MKYIRQIKNIFFILILFISFCPKSRSRDIIPGNDEFYQNTKKRKHVDLLDLTSSQGFYMTGEGTGYYTGYSVSMGGDVNGDGKADMAIGAYGYNSLTGKVYVVYGGSGLTNMDLSGLSTSGKGITITGAGTSYDTGYSVSIGDANGDGKADILIGAWGYFSGLGFAYLIFGSTSMTDVALASITASQGITIGPEQSAYYQAGKSVSLEGDYNNDGKRDILIGGGGSYGRVYLVYGVTSFSNLVLNSLSGKGFYFQGESTTCSIGTSVSIGGDVNGDGKGDLLIGSINCNTNTGKVYLIYGGAATANLILSSMTTQGITITGEATSTYTGRSVSVGGDVNGDGKADMLIGADGYGSGAGRAYLIYGGSALSNIALATLTTAQGITITGEAGSAAGTSVSIGGDVNGDGKADMLIGAISYLSGMGRVYLIWGGSGLANIDLTTLTSAQGVVITGEGKGFNTGRSVSVGGDMNGDGKADILFGAEAGGINTGRAYVIYGAATMSNIVMIAPSSQPTSQPTKQPFSRPTGQPSREPTGQPSRDPTGQPTSNPSSPTCQPTGKPTCQPSCQPSCLPTQQPTSQPTSQPISYPSAEPSSQPTVDPTMQPSSQPSRTPTSQPTSKPTVPTSRPTSQPSQQPINRPSAQPSMHPSGQPSTQPTNQPTRQPSTQPSSQPTQQPSAQPSRQPTSAPSSQPTGKPSVQPSSQPSMQPNSKPSRQPSTQPSNRPTSIPSNQPSSKPSTQPTAQPTNQPSSQPSNKPTAKPSAQPSLRPFVQPSSSPSSQPSTQPSTQPAGKPSTQPTSKPSMQPTSHPSSQPSSQPSTQPSGRPSSQPSRQPSSVPSRQPSGKPSTQPTSKPSMQPTSHPSSQPSSQPSNRPTGQPTTRPTGQPSSVPSTQPTIGPSSVPTNIPTSLPSCSPSALPTQLPSCRPSGQPSSKPSSAPSQQPSGIPTLQPTGIPTSQPTKQPTNKPTGEPTGQPSSIPTTQPSGYPTGQPNSKPSTLPTLFPTSLPSSQPTELPTILPTAQPSAQPTCFPSVTPTAIPSARPSTQPSGYPTDQPSSLPSAVPSPRPSMRPTSIPSEKPTNQPTNYPSTRPTDQPTLQPSSKPSVEPSFQPSTRPTTAPSMLSSSDPTSIPTLQPVCAASSQPASDKPVGIPTKQPISQPPVIPSSSPSKSPIITSKGPTRQQSLLPSLLPTAQPSLQLTSFVSISPTTFPPSTQSNSSPSAIPSTGFTTFHHPTSTPTSKHLSKPTVRPTNILLREHPSSRPSSQPTITPTLTKSITISPTVSTTSISSYPLSWKFQGWLFMLGLPSSSSITVLSDVYLSSNNIGTSYVILGSSHRENTQVTSYSSSDGIMMIQGDGGLKQEMLSRSTTNLGDITRDGNDDWLIGDPGASRGYLLFGTSPFMSNVKASVLITETSDSEVMRSGLGWSSSGLGDMNGDGYGDFIISAPISNIVYLVYGRARRNFPSHLVLTKLRVSQGFKIIGNSRDHNFGISLSTGGDFNGDGKRDMLIGGVTSSSIQGVVYVVFGNGSQGIAGGVVWMDSLGNSSFFKINTARSSFTGMSVSGLGDMNGDGLDDVGFGSAPYQSSGSVQSSYVIYGRRLTNDESFVLSVSELRSGVDGFVVNGGGFMVAGLGDINGDGLSDMMVTNYGGWLGKGNGYITVFPRNMSSFPSLSPTSYPSTSSGPSSVPSSYPTVGDISFPTNSPSSQQIYYPSIFNVSDPSLPVKTRSPTSSRRPSAVPTRVPSRSPVFPTVRPSKTLRPTISPTLTRSVPSRSLRPSTSRPSIIPTRQRTAKPTHLPTSWPSTHRPSSLQTNSETVMTLEISSPGNYTPPPSVNGGTKNLVIGVNGTIRIMGSQGKTVYTILRGNHSIIVIEMFRGGYDQLDLSHFPEYESLGELPYWSHPLKFLLTKTTSVEVVLESHATLDLSGSDVIFADTGSPSSESKEKSPIDDFRAFKETIVFGGIVVFIAGMLLCRFVYLRFFKLAKDENSRHKRVSEGIKRGKPEISRVVELKERSDIEESKFPNVESGKSDKSEEDSLDIVISDALSENSDECNVAIENNVPVLGEESYRSLNDIERGELFIPRFVELSDIEESKFSNVFQVRKLDQSEEDSLDLDLSEILTENDDDDTLKVEEIQVVSNAIKRREPLRPRFFEKREPCDIDGSKFPNVIQTVKSNQSDEDSLDIDLSDALTENNDDDDKAIRNDTGLNMTASSESSGYSSDNDNLQEEHVELSLSAVEMESDDFHLPNNSHQIHVSMEIDEEESLDTDGFRDIDDDILSD